MSLYSLTPDRGAANLGEGTLRVDVPHWSARIRVLDERQRIIADNAAMTSSPDASGPFEATFSLPPGIYQVEVALGDQAIRDLVPIHPGHTTRFAPDRVGGGQTLHVDSSAPLVGATNTRQRHQDAAARWSREITWPNAPGGASQLFLFVRTLASDPEPGFAGGLKLLDASGRLITDFTDGTRRNTGQGWVAFNADLPSGSYILRRGGRNVSLRFQPLYLAAGWQTQGFLLAERYPRLHSLALNMAPRGAGFDAADAAASAADVLLDALHSDACVDLVLGAHISSLLSREAEQENPWFAIVAAHALNVAQAQVARARAASSAADVGATLSRVLAALAPLRDHPDVAALLLSPDQPAPGPFWSPPMLRVSVRRINEHATRYADTVPEGSLTDLVLDDLLINSPWTAWHTLAHTPVGNPAPDAAVGHGRSLLKVRMAETTSLGESLTDYGATLARAAAPAAPVYYLAQAAHQTDWNVASLVPAVLSDAGANAAGSDDPKAQVAQAMIRPSPSAIMPDAISVDVAGQVARLLADAQPAHISSLDAPLARTEQSLNRLQAPPEGDAPSEAPGTSGDVSRQPVSLDVFDAVVAQTLGPIARGLSGSPTESGQTQRPSFIEESVPKLLDEAGRLIAAANRPPRGAEHYAERARAAGERVHRVADELLASAGYTILTDPQGRIVFGNGAFRLFLTHAADPTHGKGTGKGKSVLSRAEREAAGQRAWESALEGMPVGTSAVPVPAAFAHHAGDTWRLQRTAVQDDRGGDLRANLNLLHNPRGKRIKIAALREIAQVAPRLTQAVLLFVDGSPDDRGDNLADIEELVEQLEQIIGTESA